MSGFLNESEPDPDDERRRAERAESYWMESASGVAAEYGLNTDYFADQIAQRELPAAVSSGRQAAQDASRRAALSPPPTAGLLQKCPRPLRVIAMFPCLRRGGAEQWLLYLMKFLDRERVTVLRCVVAQPNGADAELAAEMTVPVEAQSRESLERAVRDCDVLIVFGLPCDTLLGELRPKLCVMIAHGEGGWTQTMLANSRNTCDHVVAVSHRVQQAVCDGLPTTVIYNGVDLARLAQSRPREEVRSRFGFGDGDFVLGYVGRFSREKRTELLIRAVAELPARFKLLLVGLGRDREKLMDLANDLIPGRHAFTTASNYLGDYYRAMDAFGLVSDQEGFSLALLEAMMCELPVIVTPVGCVPEIIEDRVNGLIVEGAPASIAQAITRLVQHPRWARGLAAEGNRFALRHGHAARMARDYESLLARLWREKYEPAA